MSSGIRRSLLLDGEMARRWADWAFCAPRTIRWVNIVRPKPCEFSCALVQINDFLQKSVMPPLGRMSMFDIFHGRSIMRCMDDE